MSSCCQILTMRKDEFHMSEEKLTINQSDDLLAILLAPAEPTPVRQAPLKPQSRHFYRCHDCLTVAVTTEKLREVRDERGNYRLALCGACGGHIEYMGVTRRDYLVKQELRCACDGRCTNAIGPNCDCQCGGENHGTGRVVLVDKEHGPIPQLKIDPQAREKGEAFRALKARVWAAYTAKYGRVNEKRNAGEWIDNWAFYMDGQRIAKRIRAASELTSTARVKKLEAIYAELQAR